MSTLPTTHLTATDYARGLLDGQVDILELVVETLGREEPAAARNTIDVLLKSARRRAAELTETAGR